MKCKECSFFKDNICGKASEGNLSDMDSECLLRCQVVLLRDIWGELNYRNEMDDEGNEWKVSPS